MTQPEPTEKAAEERGLARLNALSDGVFAIAMTLLVLDVSVPPGLSEERFHEQLRETAPNMAAYALSFLVLAQLWRDHRYVLDRFHRVFGQGARSFRAGVNARSRVAGQGQPDRRQGDPAYRRRRRRDALRRSATSSGSGRQQRRRA